MNNTAGTVIDTCFCLAKDKAEFLAFAQKATGVCCDPKHLSKSTTTTAQYIKKIAARYDK